MLIVGGYRRKKTHQNTARVVSTEGGNLNNDNSCTNANRRNAVIDSFKISGEGTSYFWTVRKHQH